MGQPKKNDFIKTDGFPPEEKKVRLIDAVSAALPSGILFVGLIMFAVANPYGEYFIGVGVVLQLAFLLFRVPKLFSCVDSVPSKSEKP